MQLVTLFYLVDLDEKEWISFRFPFSNELTLTSVTVTQFNLPQFYLFLVTKGN